MLAVYFLIMNQALPSRDSNGLYNPDLEHDACGVGLVARISGERSNAILETALLSICSLMHRGALDADAKTGDGAGITTQIPYKIFTPEVEKLGHTLYNPSDLGVGVMFLPAHNEYETARARAITEEVLKKRELFVFGWRVVPINDHVLGEKAQSTMPLIEQVLVGRPAGMSDDDYERRLFLARNEIEDRAAADKIKDFYIPSFSHRTIVYKGLLVSASLEKFYPDLANSDYETAIALFHQRYSTNTFPTWPLAHPFRMLAHNGEINTIRGNRNWMHAREAELKADFWGTDIDLLKPIIQPGGSDSASLDNALEVLTMSGRSILHAVTMLVPPSYRTDPILSQELKDFYNYHRCFSEPWDGPAALTFTDGVIAGACLDRNGLRPARYNITEDGMFVMASEVGGSQLDQLKIVEKGRLAPGEMIAIDTAAGKLLRDADIKAGLAARQPYGEWLKNNLSNLPQLTEKQITAPTGELDILTLTQRQVAFGYSSEEVDMIIKPMLKDGAEAVGSMGDDTPLAVLSAKPRLLYTYFKQLFAQVTNPPIDPIREKLVMSLNTVLGWRKNMLAETPEHARLVSLESPVLLNEELAAIQAVGNEHMATTVSTLWNASEGEEGLEPAINRICADAEAAIDAGTRILILSDSGVDHGRISVPMLLAVGAVHHHLIRVGKRMRASLVCQTGEARDVHQIACLIGFGAAAVNPYLAFETIRELLERDGANGDFAKSVVNYRKAIEAGILKIMSKMGISVVSSYRGGCNFEAIGLSRALVSEFFLGLPSRISGLGLEGIENRVLALHHKAFDSAAEPLPIGGFYRYRAREEIHAYQGDLIHMLQSAVGKGSYQTFKKYTDAVRNMPPVNLRDLLDFNPDRSAIEVDQVESITEIRKRFIAPAMSLGALSPEAHETLAIAMNRMGAASNSGEGGEGPERYQPRANGDNPNSTIKQIASARFGVTAEYLNSAAELQIKVAQGAKPGEGGQLPAFKVTLEIARLRHATPGVSLISPPPHHDIYSIEDLAQLIYDLKQINPRALVSVKLVAQSGIGTIASGVAKAMADKIVIAGHTGGTGASPYSSIKHAGIPWEMGLAEANQVLTLNRMRHRVKLQTDGGLKTGRDIVIAALLGAEEYALGTSALVAMGCIYVRQCHSNTCPVGITTQDPKLRAKFDGTVEKVVNLFSFIAEEVREILASLGYKTLDEIIGRSDLLRQVGYGSDDLVDLDLNPLLAVADSGLNARYCTLEGRNEVPDTLDAQMIKDAHSALEHGEKIQLAYTIRNTQRAIGTRLSSTIISRFNTSELQLDHITIRLRGSAGQSLGAFAVRGLKIEVLGDANDYVGKGLSGGTITIRTRPSSKLIPHENTIIGNTVLYGATSGKLFAAGQAGERFAVRNSGASVVVEGCGSNGCEYMTGGTAVILGRVGDNFAAGMTGGMAFVYDDGFDFAPRINSETVLFQRVASSHWENVLKSLLAEHVRETASPRAESILSGWEFELPKFWQICPKEMVERLEFSLSNKTAGKKTA